MEIMRTQWRLLNYLPPHLVHPSSEEGSRDSSVGIATGYGLDDQEGREFDSR
jgi:hypothetical protein